MSKSDRVALSASLEKLTDQVAQLEQKVDSIAAGRQYSKKIHELNDVRDVAHFLLGLLAEREAVSLKDLHSRYQLPQS